MDFLSEAMTKGGPAMWPILLCAVFGAAIVLERFFYIFFRASINASPFWAAVQRMVLDGDVDGAIKLCNAEPSAVLPLVVKAGLVRAGQDPEEIRDGLDEAALEVYPKINRRMGFLPMIANVSTLFGLLGTIYGLVLAFEAVTKTTSEARSGALAEGIAAAMWATGFGLLVSIPVLVCHSVIAARANLLLDEIDHHQMRVLNLLRATAPAPLERGGGAPVLPFRS